MRSSGFAAVSHLFKGKGFSLSLGALLKHFLQTIWLPAGYPFIDGILYPKYI